jgi:hypothetical protein
MSPYLILTFSDFYCISFRKEQTAGPVYPTKRSVPVFFDGCCLAVDPIQQQVRGQAQRADKQRKSSIRIAIDRKFADTRDQRRLPSIGCNI